jgi:carboxyl-terminal processing protease
MTLKLKLSARRATFLVTSTLTLAVAASAAWAELKSPTALDRQITLAVTGLLPKGHLSRHALDDEMSERCLKSYLKSLDPMKLYFYQADYDTFASRGKQLDDMARKGDIGFAYQVYQTFLKRIDERVALADDILSTTPDFTVEEDIITDPDTLSYPKDEAEARESWRKRVKYDLLVQQAEGKSMEEARDRLSRRYHSFAKRMHQADRDELLEIYLTSMTSAYDPHTSYMSPSTLENFEIQMRLELEGIGAALKFDDGYTVVEQIIAGGPADKDGRLKPKDRVVGVGQGEEGEIEDVVEMTLKDVVKRIRGKRGTVVRLQVIPDGQVTPQTYRLERAAIELKDGEARAQVFEEGQKPNGEPFKVGVIDLPSFYMDMDGARLHKDNFKSTTRDVQKILADFRGQHVDAVIMDLRRNGGGSLTEAIHLTGLFIDQGPIVQVKGSDGEPQHYDDVDAGTAWDGPLVVLTSKLSASASEIFAGAIQDYGRGLVIGDKATHGKGTVQTLRELGPELFYGPNPPSLGALKITMQQFYRPNGDSTQNRGVVSDVELPSLTTHWDIAESDLDYALEFDRVPAADYRNAGLIDKTMIQELSDRSLRRRRGSEDFQKLEERITRYLEQKNRKAVSLNGEKFAADRAKLEADKEEEEAMREMDSPKRQIERDFYLNEAINIASDYSRMIRVAQNQ